MVKLCPCLGSIRLIHMFQFYFIIIITIIIIIIIICI